jgi:hypothetical protein
MIRSGIAVALLLMLAGTACATMWLYDDPTFFNVNNNQYSASSIQPVSLTLSEIIEAPFYPLLGESFYKDALPVQMRNTTQALEISTSTKSDSTPVSITFSGNLENNLAYASSKSSLRVAQGGSWETLSPSGLVM